MTHSSRQLPLPFIHAPHYATADFLPARSNAEALAWLDLTADWPSGRLALWGEEGSGKTHLLHLWARRQGADLLAGPALGLGLRGALSVTHPVAIDDADAAPELPLLHLLNAAAEARQPVLLAGRAPAARWPVRLPDLASRLRATVAVGIGNAEDSLLRALLARLLAERQLAVPEGVQAWLLLHLARRPGTLREAVARLDRAALAEGGAITRPLAARIAAELADEDEVATEPAEDDRFGTANVPVSPAVAALL
jgi:chromosomal replication initiation ATPase DnaA